MALAKLTVLAGPQKGKSFEVGLKRSYLSITESKGVVTDVDIQEDAADDARFCEVAARGDVISIRNLRPWQTVSVNGDKRYDQGERATVRDGDVVVVRDVVLRVSIEAGAGMDVETTGMLGAVPPEMMTSSIVAEQSPADLAKLAESGVADSARLEAALTCLQLVGGAALSSTGPTPLLTRSLDLLGEAFPDAKGAVLWRVPGSESFRRVARLRLEAKEVRVSRTVLKHVLESGTAVLSEETQAAGRVPLSDSATGSGMRSVLCVPIVRTGAVAGVVHLDRGVSDPAGRFDEGDLAMVRATVATIEAGLDALETRRADRAAAVDEGAGDLLAGTIAPLLPAEGVRSADVQAALGFVGRVIGDGSWGAAVVVGPTSGAASSTVTLSVGLGDVAAERPARAIGAFAAHAAFRAMARSGQAAPAAIVDEVGRAIEETGAGAGARIVASWDAGRGRLSIATADSINAVHWQAATGAADVIPVHAPVPGFGAPENAVALAAGDVVVLIPLSLYAAIGGERDPAQVSAAIGAQAAAGATAVVTDLIGKGRTAGAAGPAAIAAIRRG